ncbi:hypothetical protein G9A89_015579 [Geosiphon pyriformis]|nr:hypothetical protein G9A89_015579 [Geosiphon pyriformis]
MGTTVHDLWNFISSVGGKTCFIDYNSVSYFRARCATVCFDSELDLIGAMTFVNILVMSLSHQSVKDTFRLARIYAKKSALISCSLAFGGKTWTSVVDASSVCTFYGAGMSLGFNKIGELLPLVVNNLESYLVSIESSLVSLAEQISELAKRLESLMLAVSQPSPELAPLLQNQGENIVIGVGLGEATSDRIDPIVDSTASLHVVKLEKILDGLFRVAMCNVRGMNVPAKQDDIVCWHKDINNLVSIFMETKLRNKTCLWLVDKFDDVYMFFSGLDSGYVGAGVMIVMNRFLARHMYKVSEANEINSLIARAINESFFVILGGNFNKDSSHKCASFKKCHDLGLINSLDGSFFAKAPTWSNSQGVAKTIDYVFVSSNLVNVIIQHNVFVVSEHFDMDYKTVFVSLDTDEIKWNNFKSSTLANAILFLGEFAASVRFSDLNTMWCVVCNVITLLANKIFKKRRFKGFDKVFTKNSSKFHKLELLSSVVQNLVDPGAGSDHIYSDLFSARKSYCASKLTESLKAKKTNIRSAINKRMESFEVNKGHIIRSVLKRSFHKVVLNHLVVNNDLILKPDLVKSEILFKILSDRIFSACSAFDVLHGANFSVLKGTTTQSPIFAIGSVVEDALKKNQELWLVLQDMSHDLQVLCWQPVHPLVSSAHVCVNTSNNFLTGMVHILFDCKLSLGSSLASSFQFYSGKKLDPHGPVPEWFELSVVFLVAFCFFPLVSAGVGPLNICGSNNFVSIYDHLSQISANNLFIYTDGLLKNLGTIGYRAGAAAFFEDINLSLGVSVYGLLSSTLMELQTIALALECMPTAHFVHLFLDSQAALDVCKLESNLVCPDFHNWCWVKCWHIRNVIHRKNLRVNWHKVKSHFGISGNNYANSITDTAFLSGWYLSPCVSEYFLLADGGIVFGNFRHFVYDVFCAVCYACWKVSSGSGFLDSDLCSDVNWLCFSKLYTDGFLWLFESVFTINITLVFCVYIVLKSCMSSWRALSGLSFPSSGVLQLMSTCVLDFPVSLALYKSFEAISIFHNSKVAGVKIADFVHSICLVFRNDIWLVYAKHRIFMEKNSLIPIDDLIPISIFGLASEFSAGVIKLLGVVEVFGICFGFRKSCVFFSGIGDPVSVNIST